ncbi:hypothetical protein Bhyg_00586 [Pseudolycoriella hygida]|uniref:Uncharacterized protein n=1 Tax=Pseudolycoriella hygida TaxID=35572 RepID=A0A9Q0S6K3_9DIPT|nr:hypothetical protein Bhyg_00586 [Pseudolycoriella hygida]
MRSAVGRILLKVFELLGCIACVITKALTDLESGRVFLRNQKLSREWGLLHNLFWSQSGNAFANVTYGGFTLIIALMLISRFIDAKSRPSLVEKIFLTVGMLCFFAMGGLVFAAFDQVPKELHDNAIVLGCLSFFVAILILIDLADPMARYTSDTTQTENNNNNSNGNAATVNAASPLKLPNGGIEIKPINGMKTVPSTDTAVQIHEHEDSRSENHSPPPQSNVNIPLNGTYHRSDEVDFVQTAVLPKVEQPVFEKVLLPEKRRPEKHSVQNPRENTSQTEFVTTARQSTYDQRQMAYDQRQTSFDQNNFSHQDPYRNIDNRHQPHHNYGYVRDNAHATRNLPSHQSQFTYDRYDNRPLMVVRDYSNARANMSYDQRIKSASYRRSNNLNNSAATRKSRCRSHCSSDDDENVSAIQPGFVANAAKVWDSRAKRDFNTVV